LEAKALEIPKPTVSEKEKPIIESSTAPTPVVAEVISKPGAPRDLGRGGEQHKTIQQRLKAAAEELGFLAVIEKEILDGDGSIDLSLERPGTAIACEISVTTSTDHEFGKEKNV
jgi:hypothetical protein